eukprot:CAMPEP_0113840246 /NCGR_PEP_ID=MMETSP0328-20130328/11521_1 /TAXON_ID=39455 /ORGANISM="Alexandrium minutum" /LENGTH=77 /DNA_ID=CAMNT_0000808935 /DNA_START=1 /DNA_END=230 /DNA_ORIENTATION=+ /assembly_acc=CAM_ASM_000350
MPCAELQDPRPTAQRREWPRCGKVASEVETALPDLGATVIVDSLRAIQVDIAFADYVDCNLLADVRGRHADSAEGPL